MSDEWKALTSDEIEALYDDPDEPQWVRGVDPEPGEPGEIGVPANVPDEGDVELPPAAESEPAPGEIGVPADVPEPEPEQEPAPEPEPVPEVGRGRRAAE